MLEARGGLLRGAARGAIGGDAGKRGVDCIQGRPTR
jgi:hypothetical protein